MITSYGYNFKNEIREKKLEGFSFQEGMPIPN